MFSRTALFSLIVGLLAPGCVVTAADEVTSGTSADITSIAFRRIDDMSVVRYQHAAAPLRDGHVLVTSKGLTELIDPVSGHVAQVATPRKKEEHGLTATTLPNGNVVVVGGLSNNGYSNVAETYDPENDIWRPAGNMKDQHGFHTATWLDSIQRLLVIGGGVAPQSVELYDPSPAAAESPWQSAAPTINGRSEHATVLLADGRVLVTGGQRAPTTTELFDPTNGTWKPAHSMNAGHQAHTATTLRDGRVLVVGGFDGSGSTDASKKVEIYDPGTNRWTFAAEMTEARVNHSANLLADGRVLVIGGRDGSRQPSYSKDSEIYDPSSNTWSEGPSLVQSRAWHTATSLANGTIVVAGGQSGGMQTSGQPPVTAYVESERKSVEVLGTSSGGKLGGACTDASGCESGFCVDGVCCDTACGGGIADCQACSVRAGGTSNGHCSIAKPKTVCRPVQPGCACDVAETCDGTSAECPADAFVAGGTVCRAAAGSCDLAEVCTGTHPFCGDDDFKPNGAACDVASCNSHGTCKSGECIPDVGMCQ